MNSSWKLLTIRGIDIRVHLTFPLILLWAAFQFGFANDGGALGATFGVVVALLLFGIVTLHELGHSFAAQYYGVPVERIVLLPIGGVAQLKHIPDDPKQEFVIAVAGPAVNLVLGAGLWLFALVAGIEFVNPLVALSGAGGGFFAGVFSYIFYTNIVLMIFNLIPAFPLDGGRILRSLLAMRLEYGRATNIAVRVGRFLAMLLGLYGLATFSFFTVLIAIFIYSGAGQEGTAVRLRGWLRRLTVEQVYSRQVIAFDPNEVVQNVMGGLGFSPQRGYPVVAGGRLVGFVSQQRLLAVARSTAQVTYIYEIMQEDVPSTEPAEMLSRAQQKLEASNLEALPVVENGFFVGLLSRQNIEQAYYGTNRAATVGQPPANPAYR